MKNISRRDFLKLTSQVAALGAAGSCFPGVFTSDARADVSSTIRTLGFVFLSGGPDTIRWLQPMGSYGAQLAAVRTTLLWQDAQMLPATLNGVTYPYGFSPDLPNLASLFSQGSVAIIRNCGSNSPTRDHEAETLVAQDGSINFQSRLNTNASNGILQRFALAGRWDSPLNLFSYQGGGPASVDGPFSGAVTNGLSSYGLTSNGRAGTSGRADNGAAIAAMYSCLGYQRTSSPFAHHSALAYDWDAYQKSASQISAIANLATGPYPTTGIGKQLQNFARTIRGISDNGTSLTKVRAGFMAHGGHDTHADQVSAQQKLHPEFDNSVKAFYDDIIVGQGRTDVVLVAFGEFSRTVRQNDTGTDHGAPSTVFVIGHPSVVKGGIYGSMNTAILTAAINANAEKYEFLIPDLWGTLAKRMGIEPQSIVPSGHTFSDLGFLV